MNHPNRSKSSVTQPTPAEVKASRESAGLTQRESAAVVYVTLSAWQRWEQGERPMHCAFWELWRLKTQRRKVSDAMSQFPAFQAYRDAVSKAWDQSRMTLSDSAPPCDDRAVSNRAKQGKE